MIGLRLENANMIAKALFYGLISIMIIEWYLRFISLCTLVIFMIFIAFVRYIFLQADCDMLLLFYDSFGKSANSLKEKVIWITGASSGIGAATALELAQGKVRLILSARSEGKLQNVKKKCMELGNLSSEDVLVLPFDMTDYDKHEWAFSTVIEHFGQLDVLVSNAGRTQRAHWENIEPAVDKALFDVNVFSLVNLCRVVTKHFLVTGSGKHVVVSSNAGKFGIPGSASYVGSKYAVLGYFEALRSEKGSKGISVNIILPGPTVSNIMDQIFSEKLDEKLERKRIGEMMTTERTAHLIVVAMANNISEAWFSLQPFLLIEYIAQYMPILLSWYMNNYDFSELIMKLRDGAQLPSAQTKQE